MKKTKTYDYDPVDFIETDEKGLTRIAKEAGMTRRGLRKALSEDGNPGRRHSSIFLKFSACS